MKRKHDFPALVSKVLEASIYDVDAPPPPEMEWNLAYGQAIEQVIEQGNAIPLIRMLDAGLPVHPLMLPALADAIRAISQGRRSGAHRALTSIEERAVVSAIKVMARTTSLIRAQERIAGESGVSVETVRRAWRKRPRTPFEY